jgi:predicted GNAT family N-acyltransferase
MASEVTFRIARSVDDLIKVFVVRGIVFVGEQDVRYAEEMDEHEHAAVHVLGELDGEPVAAARVRYLDGVAKLERMAVRKEHRGRGFGSDLLRFAMQLARDAGFTRFEVHAQLAAAPFYHDHGFRPQGDPFTEAGIQHCLMTKVDA